MKFLLKIFFVLTSLIGITSKTEQVNDGIYARSYVVMEQNSGNLLESKDCNLKRSVASVSKIMTAILAIESDNLFNAVTVGEEIKTIVGSSLYLAEGTNVNIIELVYGLLLRSGNDAAVTIAKNVGGSIEDFVSMMNNKAQEIGMKNTVFSNPSGLDMYDEGNVSTSYDLALLMRYCMNNGTFREINRTQTFKSSVKGTWSNKHKLIQNYEYAIGGKTGYTKKAKRTLITSARKDDLELIVVTLDCGSDFAFHKAKFERYFASHTYLTFLNKGTNYILNYEIVVDKEYGIIIENLKLKNVTKHYQINPKNNEVKMYLVFDDNSSIEVGRAKVITFKIN
ncbi:MAG: D-alanyl-D-alanine carboxypeptidase [Erysipelotrichales bacterium]|nr:D-alanyl-D-alanine carboxypeptidase [Erysipelotrichales bacterium]